MYAPSAEAAESTASQPQIVARAMCKMLVQAGLDIDKLFEIYKSSGLPELELSLRTAFLHKMVGQPRAIVDQVCFC